MPTQFSEQLLSIEPKEILGPDDNPTGSQELVSANEPIADVEKNAEILSSIHDRKEEDIVYLYLTFNETRIFPTEILAKDNVDSVPSLSAPDLQKYDSPLQWPHARKELHMWLCCLGTLIAAYTPGAYLAGAEQLENEFDVSSLTVSAGITVFTGCFAIAPMVLAPFSEIIGRKPLFTITGIIFVASQVGAGVSASFAGLMVSRATAGMSASTFSSMVVGVLSDIYAAKDRNRPMILFSAFTFAGTGLGPGISGIMVQYLSWRWTWYLQSITCGLTVLAQTVFFRESRANVLLSRKAKALNTWYSKREAAGLPGLELTTEAGKRIQVRWKVKSDEERASIPTMIKISLFRPFHLLFTESIVFWFSAWLAFAWMILYFTFAAIPLLFTTNHGFDSQASGLVFFTIVVSSFIFGGVSLYQEKLSQRSARLRFEESVPESRLYFACFESALFPIGIFWLAWTQFPSVHWIVPTLAIAVTNFGICSIYLAAFNFLADTYHSYASSAVAAQSFCRNMLGATIPLYEDQMLLKMTFQGGLSLLGGVAVLLTFVPWALVVWGPEIRRRSPIAGMLSNKT